MWPRSSHLLRLACLCALLFAGLSTVLAQTTPQSTPSAQNSPGSPPSAVWSLSKASAELLTRLTERQRQIDALQADSQTAKQALDEARRQLSASQSALMDLQAEHAATLNLLADSRTRLTDFQASTADQIKADAEAIKQARAERDAWAIGGASALIVAGAYAVCHALGWVP